MKLRLPAVILVILCEACGQVRTTNMNTQLKELPLSSPESTLSLRLADANGLKLIRMVASDSASPRFLVSAVGQGQEQAEEQVFPRHGSEWDAASSPAGALQFAMSNPESATVWLSLVDSASGNKASITAAYMDGFFGSPRFVRRQAAILVTSIAQVGSAPKLVLFSRSASGGFGSYRLLPEGGAANPSEGLLIKTEGGFLMVTKKDTGTGARPPGHIFCSSLDEAFQVRQAPRQCLGDREVYGFDADALQGKFVLAAETAAGLLIASGNADQSLTIEDLPAGPVTSVSVIVHQGRAHLAAIEHAGSRQAKILMGSFELK